MNLFDIFINFFESLCYCLFIFYILKNKTTSFLSFIIFSFIHFITLCIFNYYLLPEIILILSGIFILFLFSNSINKNEYVQNIFLILFIFTIGNFSVSIALLLTSLFFKFPFYSGNAYLMLVIISKSILFILASVCALSIKKYHILQTKKLNYCLLALLFLNIIYSSLSDFIFYSNIFNQYIITICICVNLLSFFLCLIFLENKKEQDKKLDMQKNMLELKNQENLYKENQKSIQELNKWKHDIKHILNTIILVVIIVEAFLCSQNHK